MGENGGGGCAVLSGGAGEIGQTRTLANLKRRIERLGYHVILEPQAAAA
jgi:hypothetical protein